MATSTKHGLSVAAQIRPFDTSADLEQLADLMELAFGRELEATENRIVHEMRRMARLGTALWLLDRIAPLMCGFVYVEGNYLLGNVTLSEDKNVPRQWIMSNVAVHPDWQGRGIATELVKRSLGWVRARGGLRVRLQVRTDNTPAQALYSALGFERYDTTYELLGRNPLTDDSGERDALRRLSHRNWHLAYKLALAATPVEVQRVVPVRESEYKITRAQWLLERAFGGIQQRQEVERLGLFRDGRMVAYVRIRASNRSGQHRFSTLVHPEARGTCESVLVDATMSLLEAHPTRSVFTVVSLRDRPLVTELGRRGLRVVRVLDQLVLDVADVGGRSSEGLSLDG
jgi:ribosomal protein S18 acetylase RimI-like enzyme